MAPKEKTEKTKAKKKPVAKKTKTRKTTTAKKSTTKKKPLKAGKPSKRAGTPKKKIKFTDVKDLINQGVEQFEVVHTTLTAKLDQIEKIVSDIRQLIADKGGDPDKLNKAVASMNSLNRLRVKMDSYMNSLRSESTAIEQKVAILENMQTLTSIVDNLKVTK